ncbi:hypothetical protein MRX96_009606 [Rhipicephalus microplus]
MYNRNIGGEIKQQHHACLAKAPGGPLAPPDLLIEVERRPELHRPCSTYDVLKDVQDQEGAVDCGSQGISAITASGSRVAPEHEQDPQ